jgi:MFS transporter, MHS family, citrate/tricarballylate:H+ symporter
MQADEERPRISTIATVLRLTSGNFLEFFDFFLYGFYARNIAATFFPSNDEFASLMATLVVFGAGFLVRPLGALVLGSYLDRVGRRKGLLVSLSVMAVGTVLIAFMPGYATIGVAAPVLMVFGRLLQGFSAGAEAGGVAVYLSEMATPGHRGFYVSWQSCSQQLAIVASGICGFTVNMLLAPAQIADWGWRLPFAIGCAIVPVLFLIRRSLPETAAFAARTHRPPLSEALAILAAHWRVVGAGVMMAMTTTVSFYLITAYTPTFGQRELKLSAADSMIVTCCVGLSNFIWMPVWGAVSDRIGRKPILLGASALMILTAYPALAWLISSPSFDHMLFVELWLSLLYAAYNGAMTVALTEVVPAAVRVSGFSFAYSMATTLGGFSLAISTWLIELTGNKAAPGLWMSAGAACGLVATLMLYGTPRRSHATRAALSTNSENKNGIMPPRRT